MFKAIINDHSIGGKKLNDNIVIIAECNPAGRNAVSDGYMIREIDLGRDWASGHYQVHELLASLDKLKWVYGALDCEQDK